MQLSLTVCPRSALTETALQLRKRIGFIDEYLCPLISKLRYGFINLIMPPSGCCRILYRM